MIRNIILFTLDCVRADRLGCYGYSQAKTPYLDGLAARGVRFTQAITAANSTDPSHASILTGCYPNFHGVMCNGVRLPNLVPTVAQVLREHGYRTMAAVSVEHLSSAFGFNRGFVDYFNSSPYDRWYPVLSRVHIGRYPLIRLIRKMGLLRTHWRRGHETNQWVLSWVCRHAREPFFVWVHYFDAHYYRGRRHADTDPIATYNRKVSLVDGLIGEVLATLEDVGIESETLVIATADHGESQGEHLFAPIVQSDFLRQNARAGHGVMLYDEEIRVPLIISPWPRANTVIEQQVRTIDLAPTILEVLGLEAPTVWQGASLVPLLEGQPWDPQDAFVLAYPEFVDARCIRTGEWKLIRWNHTEELYDLKADPKEQHNLIAERRDMAAELRARLDAWEAGGSVSAYTREEDEAIQAMLRDLGYLE